MQTNFTLLNKDRQELGAPKKKKKKTDVYKKCCVSNNREQQIESRYHNYNRGTKIHVMFLLIIYYFEAKTRILYKEYQKKKKKNPRRIRVHFTKVGKKYYAV